MTHDDLQAFRHELTLALQDAVMAPPVAERIVLAIDGLIQLHLAQHKLHEPFERPYYTWRPQAPYIVWGGR